MGSVFSNLKNFCRDIILLIPCISSCCIKKEEHNETINKIVYKIRCDDEIVNEAIRHEHGHNHYQSNNLSQN